MVRKNDILILVLLAFGIRKMYFLEKYQDLQWGIVREIIEDKH